MDYEGAAESIFPHILRLEGYSMAVEFTREDLLKNISQNGYSYRNTHVKKVTEVNEDVEKLQDSMSSFKRSVKWLKKYSSGESSKTRLEKELKSLLKAYNEMDQNADSVTDKDVKKQLEKLEKLFTDNSRALKKIGIDKKNGKYTLNSKTLEDADGKDLNALFAGHDSFMSNVDRVLRKVEDSADDAHYSRVNRKITNVTNYDEASVTLAGFMTLAQQTQSVISQYNNIVQSGNLSAEDEKNIKSDLMYFAVSAYKTYSGKEETGSLEQLNKLCKDNEEKLNKLGITFDADYSKMSFAADTDLETAEFKQAYDELFGENAEFGKKVSEYTLNVFNGIIKPDKIGVSIIDMSV